MTGTFRLDICNYIHVWSRAENELLASEWSRRVSSSEVAKFVGISESTLLSWLRADRIAEPARDRRGWRTFSADEAECIRSFATRTSCRAP